MAGANGRSGRVGIRPGLGQAACLVWLALAGAAGAQTPPDPRDVGRFIVPIREGEVLAIGPGEVLSLVVPDPVPYGPQVAAIEVREVARQVVIRLAADILFDFDKAKLKPEARPALEQAAAEMRARPNLAARIEGHTDSKGRERYNMQLSQRRAQAVRTWLGRNAGFDARRLRVAGFAARRPVAPNAKPDGSDNPEGRQLNRRVEIVLSPS